MRQFWFDGDSQFAPIGTLSGGERRRLQLLLTLLEQPNVLLLDEPTNDLDLDTLRALEEFLDDWPGIVVVVSHDRVFLDRTVTEVLALDGNGPAAVVRGGVAGWLAQRAARPAGAAGSGVPAGAAPPGPRRAPASTPAERPVSRKSPSTLRHQLGLADRALAEAIATRDAVQAEFGTAGSDHEKLTRLSAKLATSQGRVDAAEERWLSLADEAESLRMEI
jgi:ATP-binding cassette subfamily F protein uup